MNPRFPRPALALALAAASLSLAYAHVSAAPPAAPPATPARQERTPLDQELGRVQLEQELMLAEHTARMLDELQSALAEWDRQPSLEAEADGDARR